MKRERKVHCERFQPPIISPVSAAARAQPTSLPSANLSFVVFGSNINFSGETDHVDHPRWIGCSKHRCLKHVGGSERREGRGGGRREKDERRRRTFKKDRGAASPRSIFLSMHLEEGGRFVYVDHASARNRGKGGGQSRDALMGYAHKANEQTILRPISVPYPIQTREQTRDRTSIICFLESLLRIEICKRDIYVYTRVENYRLVVFGSLSGYFIVLYIYIYNTECINTRPRWLLHFEIFVKCFEKIFFDGKINLE